MADSHNAKRCTRQCFCSSYKGNHLTLLYGYIPKEMKGNSDGSQDNGNIKSNYAVLDHDVKCARAIAKWGFKVISMCIVPVRIKHGDNSKMVTTCPSAFADPRLSWRIEFHGCRPRPNLCQHVGPCTWGLIWGAVNPPLAFSLIPGFQIAFPCIIRWPNLFIF